MSWLSWKEAFKQIIEKYPSFGLDQKVLDNWAKSGKEITFIKEKNRNGFTAEDVLGWEQRIENSIVFLNNEDYKRCFLFAVEAYYGTMTRADFNRGKQRDVGEFITNQVQGKLGEIAVEKMLKKYGLEIQLDFNVNGQIPSQDITQISTRRNVWNNPLIKVSIKSTKLKNIMLAIPESETSIKDRRSDVYILSQVGLFSDHILRIIKQYKPDFLHDHLELIPDFDKIPARIAGWITYKELTKNGPMSVSEINENYGINMAGPNHIKVSGELSIDWEMLKDKIIGNA